MRADGNRRERGAYFTPRNLAAFVAGWGIRSSADVILDPAAGLGSLIGAAVRRARALGAGGAPNVWGVELHPGTFERLQRRCLEFNMPSKQLTEGDFFDLSGQLGRFDVILMNPPYVRHHELRAATTTAMRATRYADGSVMDGRSSSWAYFVVRAMQMLRTGGRLAAIVPGELVGADYGRRVLDEVSRSFERTVLVRCEGKPFGDLQLTTIVILGEGFIDTRKGAEAVFGCTVDFAQTEPALPQTNNMVRTHDFRRSTATLFTGARAADLRRVDSVVRGEGFRRLDQMGRVRIGYVTGESDFFHLTECDRKRASIARTHLRRAVHRGSHVDGSVFRAADWQATSDMGKRCWLFHPMDEGEESVKRRILEGVASGVAKRAKCRMRTPWWRVTLGEVPAAMFVYMGRHPRIVENRARVQAANSLYILQGSEVAAGSLAVASMTSVFQFCALMMSRRLGGGLRKLQLGDAASLPIAAVEVPRGMSDEIDSLVRDQLWDEAVKLADEVVLKGELGWADSRVKDWQSRLRQLSF